MAVEEIWETPFNIIKDLKKQELSHEKKSTEEKGQLTGGLETC